MEWKNIFVLAAAFSEDKIAISPSTHQCCSEEIITITSYFNNFIMELSVKVS